MVYRDLISTTPMMAQGSSMSLAKRAEDSKVRTPNTPTTSKSCSKTLSVSTPSSTPIKTSPLALWTNLLTLTTWSKLPKINRRTTNRLWSSDYRTISMMQIQVTYFRSRWIAQGLEGSEQLTEHQMLPRTSTIKTDSQIPIRITINMGHKVHSPIKVSA